MIPEACRRLLFDFTRPDAQTWLPIGDAVMGGVSRGEMRLEEGRAVFSGVVALDYGGGFASVRSSPGSWDLSGLAGIELSLRGDGRRYKLRMKTDAGFDGVTWQGAFETRRHEGHIVQIPFQSLIPTYRGTVVSQAPPFDSRRIHTFGLLISDQQAGPFRLEIERIVAYR